MNGVNKIQLRLFDIPALEAPRTGYAFPAKGFQLVALLLLSSSGRITRQAASSLLWEKAGEAEAQSNLRQLIFRMRRAWPGKEELVESSGQTLTAGPGAALTDLHGFLGIDETQDPRQVLARLTLFRGDLLHGMQDMGTEYSYWLLRERSRLREKFFTLCARTLHDLTRYAAADAADLAELSRLMLSLEPEREQSYRELMEAYGRNGMGQEAEKILAMAKDVLKREFGTEPSSETAAVARRVFASVRIAATAPTATIQERPRIAFSPPDTIGTEGNRQILRALLGEVANELSRYRTFAVIAPHSSFGPTAQPLRVDYQVSTNLLPGGSVLSCRLHATSTREILWASEFPAAEEKLAQTFRLLSTHTAASMARAIEKDRLSGPRLHDGRAYARYLEGQATMQNVDLPRLRRSRIAFRDAAAMDPRFAGSRAKLAQTYQLEWLLLGGGDPALLVNARLEAQAAIEIDPNAGDGYWMGGVTALYQRDFDRSIDLFATAESLNPNAPDLLVQYADALSHIGDPQAAWERFEKAVDLNPSPPDHYWWAGAGIAFLQQDFARAIELCQRVKQQDSVLRLLAASHGLLGDVEAARRYGRRVRDLYPGQTAADMVRLVPDRIKANNDLFLKGLNIADIK